jgi:CHAT domain-containing protein
LHPPSAEQLLAQAYTEHRTIEVRIPGANYAPMRVERSGGGSNLDKPAALLKAEALISENLQKHPADPAWLQARARADLLDGNYESAIKTLQRALEIQPDSPSLLADLGSAYFVRAETADRAIDYGNSIEELGKALAKAPDDPVALFNRALACERMFLYTQAVEDWEHYLRVDPQGDWAAEARKRLAALREKLKTHAEMLAEPLLTAKEIAQAGSNEPGVREQVKTRIEDYTQIAIKNWLPKAYPRVVTVDSENYRTAVRSVAEILSEQYSDRWLLDLISPPPSRSFSVAVAKLSSSVHASDGGDFELSNSYAMQAAVEFSNAGNNPGRLRAHYQSGYALHQSQLGSECLRTTTRLQHDLDSTSYPWLKAQTYLEEGTCSWLVGDLGAASRFYKLGLQQARNSLYPTLNLRAINHVAGINSALGDEVSASSQTLGGLSLYWSATSSEMQGYNLYFALHEIADWLHHPHWDEVIWKQAVETVDSLQDSVLRAAAHEYFANSALEAGLPELARSELKTASQLFRAAPQTQSTTIALLEAEIRLADLEVSGGNASLAYDTLSALKPQLIRTNDNLVASIFYRALGEAEIHTGKLDEAEQALNAAVTLTERNLRSVRDQDARSRWIREGGRAYRSLVELKLRAGASQQALEIWEWYLGASRRGRAVDDAAFKDLSPSQLASGPSLPRLDHVVSHLPLLVHETVVTFAVFEDGVAVWAFDNRAISFAWVHVSHHDLARRIRSFRDVCSDPSSELRVVREKGTELYALLVGPVESHLSPERTLILESDDVIDSLPFEPLITTSNQYLGDKFVVVSSPGLDQIDGLRTSEAITTASSALVVSVPSTTLGQSLVPLPDVDDEAVAVTSEFRSVVLLQRANATYDSFLSNIAGKRIFHFAGHAIASPTHPGLLFSDRVLDAASAKSADLAGLQLVVLSACETDQGADKVPGDPDSLVSLFLHAGVPHVVASRWKVNSGSTRLFMHNFYSELLHGNRVQRAFQLAEQETKSQLGFEHPYFWSAFHLLGRS